MHILLLWAFICSFSRSTATPVEVLPPDGDAMTSDTTCRWTNCGEHCPTDFNAVRRSGVRAGQNMIDSTHCPHGGAMTFCCPSCYRAPTCYWRGHHNSGKCKPGCQKGEAEVWTLGFGCKSGHQSACCTTDTESTKAYANCRWEACKEVSKGKKKSSCSSEYPSEVLSSTGGFGGEKGCQKGTLISIPSPLNV